MQLSMQRRVCTVKWVGLFVDQKGLLTLFQFIDHKDEERKAAYLSRHKKNEGWTLQGIKSAGFWARWLLWNKPSLSASMADVNKRFSSLAVRQGTQA